MQVNKGQTAPLSVCHPKACGKQVYHILSDVMRESRSLSGGLATAINGQHLENSPAECDVVVLLQSCFDKLAGFTIGFPDS